MTVAIIGLGTMGLGIVQVALQNNCTVLGYDTFAQSIKNAPVNLSKTFDKLIAKSKITSEQKDLFLNNFILATSIADLKNADLVIEAVIESIEIKKQLFTEIETIVNEKCILASNTSSLSITGIASTCILPNRFIGIHFFNPAPLMALVEIIPAIQTEKGIIKKAINIIESWGKTVVIAKDTPGFIVNRVARPFYSEALRIFEEGIANKETIDHAMRQFGGFKMGPFELMDMIGHDVNYVVTETVWKSMFYDPRYKPSFAQLRLLEAKWLGKKTGKGFYDYSEGAIREKINQDEQLQQYIFNRIIAMLINQAVEALYMNVANSTDIEIAMTKGVNYPQGLLSWANELGLDTVLQILDKHYDMYHEDRYRASVLLRKMANAEMEFELE
jgi:3-hydroxybutyryl-CoA dehydrogenase